MSLIKLIDLPAFCDERGGLVVLEEENTVPFEIKRIYYLFDTKKNVSRGFHAHKNLKQLVVCVKGSCQFILDDGFCRDSIVLNSPKNGLVVEGLVWREMHDFSDDCVLLVLASEKYDESDYIRNYQEFLELVYEQE
ncbi:sugar 3,4-ketoisomerase [Thiomicrorhabdus sediminis]|uniref:WxcM-like domain-containing protein n=1 Tax=Thiomicrorhabdus sediminis TaxID=2580412 RepID=A0A4P9K4C7_9GAMM|nr:FdtA/QdtA family cupin domain-containing protein [Thiomicrorhabdus sediminis]QCU89561.1 WxcM-like domain-containing protein [Thiomicrorhabdus sediminis]